MNDGNAPLTSVALGSSGATPSPSATVAKARLSRGKHGPPKPCGARATEGTHDIVVSDEPISRTLNLPAPPRQAPRRTPLQTQTLSNALYAEATSLS
jgi:hypothetical protein